MNYSLPAALDSRWLHVAVDMQRLFAEPTDWHTPGLTDILPAVERLARLAPERTVFTRFLTPARAEDARGCWQGYYRHWTRLTLAHLDEAMLGLVAPLDSLAPPARVFDKTTHSAFNDGALAAFASERGIRGLVVSGVETDVCVLATVLDAVNLGFEVVVASDAVASSSPPSHRATLDLVLARLDQQVCLAPADAIASAWRAG